MTNQILASSSLYFSQCADDIRFSFDGTILKIVTRKDNEEKHTFVITSQTEEVINNVTHIILKSKEGCEFSIVNNQFHREDNKPAINMTRWILNFDKSNPTTLNTWCKIWMKNGLYHRDGDKPALIFQNGDLLWMQNGHFKRNPHINASVYQPNYKYSDMIRCERNDDGFLLYDVIEDEEEKLRHIDQGLLNYFYES